MKMNRMEFNNLPKGVVFTLVDGVLYMEHSEACEYLGIPRTTLNRMSAKLSLLREGDFTIYKNRKLLKAGWVYDFWKRVSVHRRSN
jgi:hypothetical protein